jgi:hypothetical protein
MTVRCCALRPPTTAPDTQASHRARRTRSPAHGRRHLCQRGPSRTYTTSRPEVRSGRSDAHARPVCIARARRHNRAARRRPVSPRAIDRTPARRSLGEHDPDKHSAERRGPAQCSEYGKPSAAVGARMQRCRNTRRGDKTNLDDQCRLVAAGDVLAFGEHIPHASNDQDPECRPSHPIERASGHVCRLPTERPQRGHHGGKRELPAHPYGCCQHMEKHPYRVPADGQHGHSQSAKRNVPVAPRAGWRGRANSTLSLGRSMAAAGRDAGMAIERCSGGSGSAGPSRR